MPRPQRPEGWLHHSHKQGPAWFRRARLSFFRWRRSVLANPATALLYRILVGTVGTAVIVVGLILVPLPGPGWLIVFLGVAFIASEFVWARHILVWGRTQLRRWTHWLAESHWTLSALVSVTTFACVSTFVWLTLKIIGLPAWVPAGLKHMLFLD